MANDSRKPDVRFVYCPAAGGASAVSFILAAVFAFAPPEGSLLTAYILLAFGVVMAGFALTAYFLWWRPWWRRRA